MAILLLALSHAALSVCPSHRAPAPSMLGASHGVDDFLGLTGQATALATALKIDAASINPVSDELCSLCRDSILPLSAATYSTRMDAAVRRTSIEDLSRALDECEETARGPLLSGVNACSADALLFPTLVLLEQTLPQHFGWTEYTDEALFWRRPRLHAYFTLMKYEAPAQQVERDLAEKLAELELPWDKMALAVPTSQLRKYPRHTL